ncbi:hypothetical protein ACFQXA_28175 [Nocardiopsis composta]
MAPTTSTHCPASTLAASTRPNAAMVAVGTAAAPVNSIPSGIGATTSSAVASTYSE